MKFYRTPFLKRDDKYFDNTMSKPKDNNINIYPTESIFEFIQKLYKLMTDGITEGRKVAISIGNPYNINHFQLGRIDYDMKDVVYPDLFLFSNTVKRMFNVRHMEEDKLGKELLTHLDRDELLTSGYGSKNIKIETTKAAHSFKSYLVSKVISTKELVGTFIERATDASISIQFHPRVKTVNIITEKIGEDLMLITWSNKKVWESPELRHNTLSCYNKKKKKEGYDETSINSIDDLIRRQFSHRIYGNGIPTVTQEVITDDDFDDDDDMLDDDED